MIMTNENQRKIEEHARQSIKPRRTQVEKKKT